MTQMPVEMAQAPVEIDWRIPPTPPGWAGAVARFVGPGKTRREIVTELVGGVACAGLLTALVFRAAGHYHWTPLRTTILALMIFDLIGGVMTTATNSGKRWYHRPAPGMRRYRLMFTASHTLYLGAVAYLMLPGDWEWLLANSALLMGSALVIEFVPTELKRPAAMGLYLGAVLVNLAWLPLPAVLAWFPVVFFLKMLVSFMVPEVPIARRQGPAPSGSASS